MAVSPNLDRATRAMEQAGRNSLLGDLYGGLLALESKKMNRPGSRLDRVRPSSGHTPIRATVQDSYGQAGPNTPVRQPGDSGYTSQAIQGMPISRSGQLCKCGMEYQGKPHLCLVWHHRLMTPEAMQDLRAVVENHTGAVGGAIVQVDLQSPDTQAFVKQLVMGTTRQEHLVLVADMDVFGPVYDAGGRRLTFTFDPPNTWGVQLLTVTAQDDPDFIKSIVNKHKESPMPVCCDKPDPRIAKSGRPYCHNCKKYLDKVPKPTDIPVAPKGE